jgi:hypothetical protein
MRQVMKRQLCVIFSIFLILISQSSFAYNNSTKVITLAKYYRATCQDYTGTWQGFMTDPQELFADGGPWPVTLSLFNHGQYIIGQGGGAPVGIKKIWAQCKDGVLSNIFWGEKGACGGFSQQGLLVSKNVLVLELNYESAMIGTKFLLFLKRKNSVYSYQVPTKEKDYQLEKVKSCH